jgi:hypothetical protein
MLNGPADSRVTGRRHETADEIREQCGESDRRASSHIRAMIWMPAGNSVLVRPIGAGRMQARQPSQTPTIAELGPRPHAIGRHRQQSSGARIG